jgi:hypothetical protein
VATFLLLVTAAAGQVTPIDLGESREGAVTPIGSRSGLPPRTLDARNDVDSPSEVSPSRQDVPTGQQLIAAAARSVDNEPAIAAELRYRIDALGHQLVGTGSYLQLGQGAEKLLRLDLKMQVGGRPATLQEIRGPEYYWIRRDVPPTPVSLGRVDLRQLRRPLAPAAGQPEEILPQGNWIMLGGLPALLASLERNFAFDEPRADEIRYTGADGREQRLPIWIVSGRWKPARLKALAGGDPDKRPIPEQLPDRVELVLGRTDQILPLFPYRLTYWHDRPIEGRPAEPREMLTLELFNVSRRQNLEPREFQYTPGEQFLDLTASFLERYGETKLR